MTQLKRSMRMNKDEAPQGLTAHKYKQSTDCTVGCALADNLKKCRKTNCSASTRQDKTEVYFK